MSGCQLNILNLYSRFIELTGRLLCLYFVLTTKYIELSQLDILSVST